MANVTDGVPALAAGTRMTIAIGALCGLAASLIWAAQISIAAIAVRGSLPPMDLVALRFLAGGVVMLPVIWQGRRHGALAGIGWRRGLMLTLAGGPPFLLMLNLGLQLAPAAHGAIIANGMIPVFTMILGLAVLRTSPSLRETVGLAVVIAGIVALGWQSLMTGNAGPWAWAGDLFDAAAAALWGLYAVLCRRWRVDALRATAVMAVVGMLVYLPLWLLFYDSHVWAASWGEVVWQAFYQGIVAGIVAILLFTRAVEMLGANPAALFSAITPALAILIAVPVLGEVPGPLEWVGMGLAIAGMVVALAPTRRRPV